MKALIQRVSSASVSVAGDVIGAVDQGLLVFVGIEKRDTVAQGRADGGAVIELSCVFGRRR